MSVRCHGLLRLRQGGDEDLGQLAALMILSDGLALLGHLDEVDVLRRASRGCAACSACKRRRAVRSEALSLVVVGPRGEGAVHRGLEVAAFDERDEEEVLVELVDQRVAQLRVPLPGNAATEPGRVVSILGEGPEVAPASKAARARDAPACLSIDGGNCMYRVGGTRRSQLLLHVGVVLGVQPLELPCDRVDLAAEAGLRDGHPARDARGQWQHL